MAQAEQAVHWADLYAEQVIREKGDKELYVAASGITPSGTVHIGNFREIISVELVVRALRERGQEGALHLLLGRLRRVPQGPEEHARAGDAGRLPAPAHHPGPGPLRQPRRATPGTTSGKSRSSCPWSASSPSTSTSSASTAPPATPRASAGRWSTASELRAILDEHRTEALAGEWWPISIFCTRCGRDTTSVKGWDGQYGVSYACKSCKNEEGLDLRSTGAVKLLWRVDWPMRWAHQRVDFEPAGKDHHSEGGSFDTGRMIVKQVYGFEAPTSFQYDFIGIKGRTGKISSSSGEVVSLRDVLEVYQPEVVRYLFASTRPNTEFAISFDLDVLKIYEDYDRCERVYFGAEEAPENRAAKEKRTYQLSQVGQVPAAMPTQIGFRHLCNLVCVYEGDPDKVLALPGPAHLAGGPGQGARPRGLRLELGPEVRPGELPLPAARRGQPAPGLRRGRAPGPAPAGRGGRARSWAATTRSPWPRRSTASPGRRGWTPRSSSRSSTAP